MPPSHWRTRASPAPRPGFEEWAPERGQRPETYFIPQSPPDAHPAAFVTAGSTHTEHLQVGSATPQRPGTAAQPATSQRTDPGARPLRSPRGGTRTAQKGPLGKSNTDAPHGPALLLPGPGDTQSPVHPGTCTRRSTGQGHVTTARGVPHTAQEPGPAVRSLRTGSTG